MDYIKELGERKFSMSDVFSTLATEGTGVGVGFIGASTVGRRIEDYFIKTPLTASSPSETKLKGWAANNLPKALVWFFLRWKATPEPGKKWTTGEEIAVDARKAIACSIVFDSLMRLANSGVPVHDPSKWKLLGGSGEVEGMNANMQAQNQDEIQKLIQENSALRGELNKALQRLASSPMQPRIERPMAPMAPPVVSYQPVEPQAVRYQPVQQVNVETPAIRTAEYPEIRERKYGFMETPPAIAERERKYGFATNEGEIANMFGMR